MKEKNELTNIDSWIWSPSNTLSSQTTTLEPVTRYILTKFANLFLLYSTTKRTH